MMSAVDRLVGTRVGDFRLPDVVSGDEMWFYGLTPPPIRCARIVCDAVFDNSPANRANPDPTKAVTWGEQTWEEMMIGYIDVDFPRSDLAASKPQDDGE